LKDSVDNKTHCFLFSLLFYHLLYFDIDKALFALSKKTGLSICIRFDSPVKCGLHVARGPINNISGTSKSGIII